MVTLSLGWLVNPAGAGSAVRAVRRAVQAVRRAVQAITRAVWAVRQAVWAVKWSVRPSEHSTHVRHSSPLWSGIGTIQYIWAYMP